MIQANPALFTKLQADPTNKALQAQAVAALGGGAKGAAALATIGANAAAIAGVIAVGPQLQTVAPYAADLQTIAPYSAQLKTIAPYSKELTAMAPYSAQLTALSKVPTRGDHFPPGARHPGPDRGRGRARPVEELVVGLRRRRGPLPAVHLHHDRPVEPA